jgi:hypothetical protein
LLERARQRGLLRAGERQRSGSTHVLAAVRERRWSLSVRPRERHDALQKRRWLETTPIYARASDAADCGAQATTEPAAYHPAT